MEDWIKSVRYLNLSDSALVVEFEQKISPSINQRVLALKRSIEEQNLDYIVELLPTYCALNIFYDSQRITRQALIAQIKPLLEQLELKTETTGRMVEIPVCYENDFAPDIEFVAERAGISVDEVIARHTKAEYLVYMLGFIPAFPYLGGMDKTIATPRKAKPRLKVEAGSVGIAGEQTGIYSLDSPAGWQIIGRTPLKLFDFKREDPFLLQAGDYLKFKAINSEEYAALEEKNIHNNKKLTSGNVEIVRAGIKMTVQDAGRFAYAAYGITSGGVMDSFAYQTANYLVGNSDKAAVLEIAYGGAEIVFHKDCQIALTGAETDVFINQNRIAMWQTVNIKKGDSLSLAFANSGLYIYIAITGGIDCEQVLGSRSTDERAGFGGIGGRAITAGDYFNFINADFIAIRSVDLAQIPEYKNELEIRVILGQQADYFSEQTKEKFFDAIYTVSNDSNRMAYRLEGAPLEPIETCDIISDAIVFGSIQVTSSGQPIIMMADHQTTGGYAKIATVITADLPKLAQARPRTKLRFKLLSLA